MKRMLSILLPAVLLFITQGNAQLLKNFGVKLAFTSASQTYDYPNPPWPGFGPDVSRRIGVNAAIYAEWLNVPFFSVVTQIEYAQRGMAQQIAITGDSPEIIRMETRYNRLDYVSLPIFLKVSVPTEVVSPYVLLGPRVDLLLSYRDEFVIGRSIYADFKKMTWGGEAGVGLEFNKLLPGSVCLEFRYNVDFMNSYDTDVLKVRNNAYDIWLGVAF